MHSWDKEKTTFAMDDANYYYKVMSIGLTNAGATYQQLINKIFKGLIGRCIKVYVDDFVVKSDTSKTLEGLRIPQAYEHDAQPREVHVRD